MSKNDNEVDEVGLFGILFVVFLVLKLCNVIDWSWWWITAPLWAPFAILAVICLIISLRE